MHRCPVCYAQIELSATIHTAEERIGLTADRHEENCPAVIVDPIRLHELTNDEALHEVVRLRALQTRA